MGLEIIQIVEDDHSQAKLLDQILRQASFRTNVAFDGPSAMQDVWRIKPSLIVADDNLPGLNGREMCKRLRQDPSTKHIPFIVLSGYSSEERRVEALDSGADDFIVKPYGAAELVARVRALLRRTQQGQGRRRNWAKTLRSPRIFMRWNTVGASSSSPQKNGRPYADWSAASEAWCLAKNSVPYCGETTHSCTTVKWTAAWNN
ncbi:MAG: response regulator transcription factor [Nitrospira sp.]|nr:response regulator transcription factor [Nitrospira sp.]